MPEVSGSWPSKPSGRPRNVVLIFLGCSEKLHRSEPAVRQEIAPHWRESFRAAGIEVTVTAKVDNTGKIGKKMKLKQ